MTKEEIIQLINKNKRLFEAEDFDNFFLKIPAKQRAEVAQFLMGDVGYPLLDNMTELPDYFLRETTLTSITIPSNIKKVGKSAFSSSELQKVVFEDNGVEELGQKAFENCYQLTTVQLPAGLKAIPKECFNRCASLKKVILPVSVVTIGTFAFKDCPETMKIISPKGPRNNKSQKLQVAQSDIPFFKKVFTDEDIPD